VSYSIAAAGADGCELTRSCHLLDWFWAVQRSAASSKSLVASAAGTFECVCLGSRHHLLVVHALKFVLALQVWTWLPSRSG
jgi:hypothetical protein